MHKTFSKKNHLTPDLDIHPNFFKIMHKRRAIIPFQMKKPVK